MKLVAIMPCRNSGWVLGLSARALLMWCDEIVILNHASTDETTQVILAVQDEFPGRVTGHVINSGVWEEMAHRQLLLDSARMAGATHVATLDDDEVVSGNLLPNIRAMVESTPAGRILQLPWLQLRGSIDRVHTSGLWGEQNASCAFPDDPEYCWRSRNGYDHHHRHPMGRPCNPWTPCGRDRTAGVMHLQMASDRRLRCKQYLYKLIERKRWPSLRTPAQLNAMYDPTAVCADALSPAPEAWWTPYQHLMRYLHVDAEPWQEAEARRMLTEEPELANGLTDYGLEILACGGGEVDGQRRLRHLV